MPIEKSVFISYRRTNSFHALAVFQHLTALGCDVFYDLDTLRGGDWRQVILENIRARAHFLIILTPSAVERFDEPNDVMRWEIETALDSRRNIVPLMLEGFSFHAARPYLTGKLAALPDFNALEIPARFFQYAMQELYEKRLQQDTDTILYPASAAAQALADEQQRVAQSRPPVSEENLSVEELFERGFIRAGEGDLDGAIADYSEAIRLKPDFAEAYNNRGIAKYEKGDYAGAMIDHDMMIRLQPDDGAYNNRGLVKAAAGDWAGALADYDMALRLNPESSEAYNNRGIAKGSSGDPEGAIADLSEAIRLRSDDANAYNNRGLARTDVGDYDGAAADLDEAIRLKPDFARAYHNRGLIKTEIGDYQGALVDFDMAVRLKPDAADVYVGRGAAKAGLGDAEGAAADYETALRIRPDHQLAKTSLKELRRKKRKWLLF